MCCSLCFVILVHLVLILNLGDISLSYFQFYCSPLSRPSLKWKDPLMLHLLTVYYSVLYLSLICVQAKHVTDLL